MYEQFTIAFSLIVNITFLIIIIICLNLYFEKESAFLPTKIDQNFSIGARHSLLFYEMFKWNRIVSINDDPEYEYQHLLKPGIKHMHIQCSDYGKGINSSNLYNVMEFLIDGFNQNEQVLIHCVVGKNRSVSLLTCFYMHKDNIDFDSAFQKIKLKRKIANVNYFQKRSLLGIYNHLKSKSLHNNIKLNWI